MEPKPFVYSKPREWIKQKFTEEELQIKCCQNLIEHHRTYAAILRMRIERVRLRPMNKSKQAKVQHIAEQAEKTADMLRAYLSILEAQKKRQ